MKQNSDAFYERPLNMVTDVICEQNNSVLRFLCNRKDFSGEFFYILFSKIAYGIMKYSIKRLFSAYSSCVCVCILLSSFPRKGAFYLKIKETSLK